MATNSEEILLRMGLDSSALKRGMEGMKSSIKNDMGSIASTIGEAFAGGLILSGIKNIISHFDDLKDQADNLGIGTDFLQGLSQIARQDAVGGVETFNKAIAELSVRLGAAKDGSEEAVKKFEKYGATLKDIADLDAEGMFYLIADRIKAIPDPAQRASAAFELLGKSGKNLTGVLANGSAELKKMVDQVDKVDAEKVAALAEAKDSLETVGNKAITIAGTVIGTIINDLPKALAILTTSKEVLIAAGDEETRKTVAAAKTANAQAKAEAIAKKISEHEEKIKVWREKSFEWIDKNKTPMEAIASHQRRELNIRAEMDAIDKRGVDTAEKKVALAKELAGHEKAITELKKVQKETDKRNAETDKRNAEIGKLKAERTKGAGEYNSVDKAVPTIEQLAGSDYQKKLEGYFGEGGAHDLASGTGPLALAAQNAEFAQNEQIYLREQGDEQGADRMRQIQIGYENQLSRAGLDTPAMKQSRMLDELKGINDQLKNLEVKLKDDN